MEGEKRGEGEREEENKKRRLEYREERMMDDGMERDGGIRGKEGKKEMEEERK